MPEEKEVCSSTMSGISRSSERDITDKDIYDACDLIRRIYLHLDDSVMPLKNRLEHARYYGKLRLNLVILKRRSEIKEKLPEGGKTENVNGNPPV